MSTVHEWLLKLKNFALFSVFIVFWYYFSLKTVNYLKSSKIPLP